MSARQDEARLASLRAYLLFGVVLAVALVAFCLLIRADLRRVRPLEDRKSTRLNSSH